jgi:hypothetical protein
VRQNNLTWKRKNLNEFEFAAEQWNANRRDNAYLLPPKSVRAAASYFRSQDENVTPVELEFLKASRERADEVGLIRQFSRATTISVALNFLLLFVLVFCLKT